MSEDDDPKRPRSPDRVQLSPVYKASKTSLSPRSPRPLLKSCSPKFPVSSPLYIIPSRAHPFVEVPFAPKPKVIPSDPFTVIPQGLKKLLAAIVKYSTSDDPLNRNHPYLQTKVTPKRVLYECRGTCVMKVENGSFDRCLEAEQGLKSRIAKELPDIDLQGVVDVKGGVLQFIPHGFIAMFGTRECIDGLVAKSVFENAESFAFAFPVPAGGWALEALLQDLQNETLDRSGGCIWDGKYVKRVTRAIAQVDVFATRGLWVYVLCNVENGKVTCSIPGGKRTLAELPWECATRELLEETGTSLEILESDAHQDYSDFKARIYIKNLDN